jgi:outer membrane protein OmpA-like peptidoglycan-associated protein
MAFAASGQTDSSLTPPSVRYYLGAFAGLGPSWDFADLRIAGFVGCDSSFRHGSGSMVALGGLVELPTHGPLWLQFRPGVVRFSGTLRERIPGGLIRSSEGSIDTIVIDQLLDYQRTSLRLGAMLSLRLAGNLEVLAGAEIEHAVQHEEVRREIAVAPELLKFANGRRDLTLLSGPIFKPSLLGIAVSGGLSFDLPISKSSTLSPELIASFPLTSLTSDGSWRSLSLQIGAAVRFGVLRSEPPRPDTPPPVIAKPLPQLAPSVRTYPPEVTVRIDEYDSTEALPLLNQIFFLENRSDFQGRYHQLSKQQAAGFSNAQLTGSALDVYYHLLNIIGRRMRELPEATLSINGYHNGRESDVRLSRSRAETIREYLASVWDIAPRRLKVTSGDLPPSPTRENSEEGFAENARVELVASDPNVTRPVVRRHIQRVATPPAITFYPENGPGVMLTDWRLSVLAEEGRNWKEFSGSGALPDSIVWDWRSDLDSLPALPMELTYRLSVSDTARRHDATALHPITVEYDSMQHQQEHRENDTTIQTFSLLLFNYDSPKVSPSDNALLRAIAENVKDLAVIRITGYTDSLGEESHNRELANMRAQETAKIFRRLVPKSATIIVDPEGGERERFPYDTPEGRSHCRTVVIEIRTPLSSKGS